MKAPIIQIDFGTYEVRIGRKKKTHAFVAFHRSVEGSNGWYPRVRIYSPRDEIATKLVFHLLDLRSRGKTGAVDFFRNGWSWYLIILLAILLIQSGPSIAAR